jgi:large subunit ribosomal protein L9
MKVILQKDVAKLGKRHTVVVVPDGYALNKLIPQGLAIAASHENLKRVKQVATEVAAHHAAEEAAYHAALKELVGKTIVVEVEANAQGHLFKAVKASDIHASLVTMGVTAIPLESIIISSPLKSCGEHIVPIQFHSHHHTITITIVAK